MFLFALIVFLAFTVFAVLLSSAIVYHIKQYTLPKYHTPQVVVTSFLFLLGFFWALALYFLIQIPR